MFNSEGPLALYGVLIAISFYALAITVMYTARARKCKHANDKLDNVRSDLEELLINCKSSSVYTDEMDCSNNVRLSKWVNYYNLLNSYDRAVSIAYEKISTNDWQAECFIYHDGSMIFAEVIMELDDMVKQLSETALIERSVLNELRKRYNADGVRYVPFDYVGDMAELGVRGVDYHKNLNMALQGRINTNICFYAPHACQG